MTLMGTCGYLLKNGQFCKHNVRNGEKFCWQHSNGIKRRWKSLTRNQTIAFTFGLCGLLGFVITGATLIWPELVPFALTPINKPHIASEVSLVSPLSTGTIPQADAVFENTGQTTAKRFRIASGFIIGKYTDDTAFERFLALRRDPNEMQSIGDLGHLAKGKASHRYGATLSDMVMAEIESGEQRMYITGLFAYEDIKGVHHEGKFCSVFVPRLDSMQLCGGSHNEQD